MTRDEWVILLNSRRRRRGGFSPADIPGLQLWLEADKITGLNDGDPVTTWEDSSVNNNDATQATAAKKPLYKVNIVNGKPAVRFDATDDILVSTFATLAQPLTLIAVAKSRVAAPGAGKGFVDSKSDVARALIGFSSLNNWSYFAGTAQDDGAMDANFHVFVGVFNGASSKLVVDGTVGSSANPGANSLTDGATIGNRPDGLVPLDGDIAEVLVYDSALSDANRDLVETYLGAKYGIAVI